MCVNSPHIHGPKLGLDDGTCALVGASARTLSIFLDFFRLDSIDPFDVQLTPLLFLLFLVVPACSIPLFAIGFDFLWWFYIYTSISLSYFFWSHFTHPTININFFSLSGQSGRNSNVTGFFSFFFRFPLLDGMDGRDLLGSCGVSMCHEDGSNLSTHVPYIISSVIPWMQCPHYSGTYYPR